jgi:hypothetical protein
MVLPPYWGFGLRDSEIPKPLVARIPDIPMTKMRIDEFLSGISPMDQIATMHPLKMDGSYFFSWFRDF